LPASLQSFTENLRKLISKFEVDKDHYLSKAYPEAQARVDFISPLFKALGWDVENEAGLPHLEREVVVERGESDTTGRPDYSFRVAGQTKFFVEAKAPSERLDDPRHVLQAKGYAWNTKTVFFVILTDFAELRFYDASIRPDERKPDEGLLIPPLEYTEYAKNVPKLWEFSRDRVAAGSLEAMLPRDRRTQRLRIPVDEAFLDEMTGWREGLARDIYKNNRDLTAKQLNEVVQRLLDRIVFIRIAEDRRVIERNQLRDVVEEWKARGGKLHIFEGLNDLFHRINEDFNGEIFKPHLSEEIRIDSDVLARIIERLYPPKSPYRFDVIGVELLGSIYERYLGKTIRVTPKQVRVEDKPEVRKAGGVYYTPKYIVDYIVRNSVGRIIEGKSPKQIQKIRILDPACGSGSFLIGAFQCLIDHYVRYLTAHPKEAHAHSLFPDLLWDGNGGHRLSVRLKAKILKNNLFGVDIDPQAVEITMMSLYLKALEGERSQLPPKQHLLPELKYNIICGNSLVGPDIYDQGTLFGDAERDRINAFDWNSEADGFGRIMKDGGFDCVIGNPPYSYRNSTEGSLRPYYLKNFRCAEGNFDVYKFFMEKDLALLRRGGVVGLIVSGTFLILSTFSKLRQMLLQSSIERLVPLGPGAFEEVTIDTAVIIYRRDQPAADHKVLVSLPSRPSQLAVAAAVPVRQARWSENEGWVFDYRLSDRGASLVRRLFARFPRIERGYEFGVGINTGFIKTDLVAKKKLDRRYHPMVAGDGISRYGPVHTSAWIMYDPEYVRRRGKLGRTLPAEHLLSSDKILVVRTRNLALPRRIIATIDTTGAYNLNRLSNIVAREGYSLLGLLAIVNSTLFNWLYATRFYDYEIKPVYLRCSPLANANDPALIGLTKRMLEMNERKHSGKLAPSELDRLEREIAVTDAEIDALVYELYGITERERKIIEQM
jgi:type I restriction-modification system DNA methylase subunit